MQPLVFPGRRSVESSRTSARCKNVRRPTPRSSTDDAPGTTSHESSVRIPSARAWRRGACDLIG